MTYYNDRGAHYQCEMPNSALCDATVVQDKSDDVDRARPNDSQQNRRKGTRRVQCQRQPLSIVQYDNTYNGDGTAESSHAEPQDRRTSFVFDGPHFGWPSRLEEEFRELWHRAMKNEKFRKYRKNCVEARDNEEARNQKGGRICEDSIWTDLREQYLFRCRFLVGCSAGHKSDSSAAMVKYQPVGRKKALYKPQGSNGEKEMGRNEILAQSLNDWLNLLPPVPYKANKKEQKEHPALYPQHPFDILGFDRKNISSHLQVLKGKFDGQSKYDAWSMCPTLEHPRHV